MADPGDQSSADDDQVSLPIGTTGANPGTLNFSATGLPDGLSISAAGLINGVISSTADLNGPFEVMVTATDAAGHSASDAFFWNVTQLMLDNPGDQVNATMDTVSLQLNAEGPDGAALTYTSSPLPMGLNINQSTGLISGTIDLEADSPTPYPITVTVSDGAGASATQTFDWVVNYVYVANPGDQNYQPGENVALPINAHDNLGDTLTYTVTGLPAGLIQSGANILGTVAASAVSASPYNVAVTVVNSLGQTTTTAFALTVTDVADVESYLLVDGELVQAGSDVYKAVLAGYKDSTADQATVTEILDAWRLSSVQHQITAFGSLEQLQKAVSLRINVIKAAALLKKKMDNGTITFTEDPKVVLSTNSGSGKLPSEFLSPKVITGKDAEGNTVTKQGVQVKQNQKPSDAIQELLNPKEVVVSDCASATDMIFYYALYKQLGAAGFNDLFNGTTAQWYIVANWIDDAAGNWVSRFITPVGGPTQPTDLIPGDMRVFGDPNVPNGSPYRFENTIYLGGDKYFAFPFGAVSKQTIIDKLVAKSAKPTEIGDNDATKIGDIGQSNKLKTGE